METILRFFFPIPVEQDQREMFFQNLPGLKRTIIYDKNRYGLRSISMKTMEKPTNTFRIICVGASTTEQSTQSTEDTWSGILNRMLADSLSDYNINIEVAAYGFGGPTAIERLKWVKDSILLFQPDMVILLEGINDLCWHGGPGYTFNGIPDALEKTLKRRTTAGTRRLLLKYSQTARRLKILKFKLINFWRITSGSAVEWHSRNFPDLRKKYTCLPYVPEPARANDPIVEFSAVMNELVKFLTASGIDVIVAAQPVLWKAEMKKIETEALWFFVNTPDGKVRPGTEWLENEMSRYNNAGRQAAGLYGAAYVGLDSLVPRTLDYFIDDCHFTDTGNIRVAQGLFPVVKERLRLIFEKVEGAN